MKTGYSAIDMIRTLERNIPILLTLVVKRGKRKEKITARVKNTVVGAFTL
jgi:hypothetical protein